MVKLKLIEALEYMLQTVDQKNKISVTNVTSKILSWVGVGCIKLEIRLISAQLAEAKLTLSCAELGNKSNKKSFNICTD